MRHADEIFTAAVPDNHLVLNADAAPAGDIEAGLDGGHDVLLVDVRRVFADEGKLVDKKADSMSDAAVRSEERSCRERV